MGFYYALEKAQFDRAWSRLRKEYQQAGMNEDAIEVLHLYDGAAFRSQRSYENWTQPFPSESISESISENSTLARRFSTLSTSFDESDFPDRYTWIETIEDQRLASLLRQLSQDDLELLTYLVIEDHNQTEAAQKRGCSQSSISTKFAKIKNFLK